MTLPASGTLAFSQINTEMGMASTANTSLSFINSNTKAAYQLASPRINNYYSFAWYQNNAQGNCNNGDCSATLCDCGICNCYLCNVCTTINCANCDARAWLQPNCNCACTYNCSNCFNCHSIDCNCG